MCIILETRRHTDMNMRLLANAALAISLMMFLFGIICLFVDGLGSGAGYLCAGIAWLLLWDCERNFMKSLDDLDAKYMEALNRHTNFVTRLLEEAKRRSQT